MSATVYSFGEWLPDLNELGNPGLLEALNVLPVDDGYVPFLPLDDFTATLGSASTTTARSKGAFIAVSQAGFAAYYAAFSDPVDGLRIYDSAAGNGTWSAKSGIGQLSDGGYDFAQYDNLVIAAGFALQAHTFGAVSNFTALATSGTNPGAQYVGVINKFVVAGNTSSGANSLQWSGFDAPRSWPTPNSATAIAQQSGAENLDVTLGQITAITNGDQFGIVMQQFGLTRLTYIGPPAVFQFDQYERGRGNFFPFSAVQVGNLVYYISDSGFCATDGVSVIDIGAGKVNKTFLADLAGMLVYGAADLKRKLIYWCYPNASATAGRPNRLIIYNYEKKKWSHAAQEVNVLFSGPGTILGAGAAVDPDPPYGFDTVNRLASFSATAGSATITSGEIEISPGDYAYVDGVKPLVTGTTPAMTVALGTRNNQGEDATFTAERTATARTGFCDFRSSARYHRARLTLTGPFGKASGVEVRALAEGED